MARSADQMASIPTVGTGADIRLRNKAVKSRELGPRCANIRFRNVTVEFGTLLAVVNFEPARLPATAECLKLIKGEFVVGHCFEWCSGGVFLRCTQHLRINRLT